jgi:hypothetical protein
MIVIGLYSIWYFHAIHGYYSSQVPRPQVPISPDDFGTARVRVWTAEGRSTISIDGDLWRYFVRLVGGEQAAREWVIARAKGPVPAGVTRSKAIARDMLAQVVRPSLRD